MSGRRGMDTGDTAALIIGAVLGVVIPACIFIPPNPFWLLDTHEGIWANMDDIALRTGVPPEWVLVGGIGAVLLATMVFAAALKYLTSPRK